MPCSWAWPASCSKAAGPLVVDGVLVGHQAMQAEAPMDANGRPVRPNPCTEARSPCLAMSPAEATVHAAIEAIDEPDRPGWASAPERLILPLSALPPRQPGG
jgi:hypothetical protein